MTVASGRAITVEVASGSAAALGTGAQEVITSIEMLKKINRFITNIFSGSSSQQPQRGEIIVAMVYRHDFQTLKGWHDFCQGR